MELLPKDRRQEKALFFDDCCSELSRLVASWLDEDRKSDHQIILKGNNVCNTKKSHDILASVKNGKVYLIDPTIWQFFADESSIFVGEYHTLNKAIDAATKKYGGDWQKGEELKKISSEEKDELLKIVKENIAII